MAGHRGPKDGKVRESKVTFKLAPDEVQKLEELAKELDIGKTVLLRNLVLSAYADTIIMKKLGIIGAVKGIDKTSNFLKKLTELKPIFYQSELTT